MFKTGILRKARTLFGTAFITIMFFCSAFALLSYVPAMAEDEPAGGGSYRDKVIAHYAMDEASGTAIAALDKDGVAAPTLDATLSGSSGTSTTNSMYGTTARYTATNNIGVPAAAFANADTNGVTFSFWYKTGSLVDWTATFLSNSSGTILLSIPNIDCWHLNTGSGIWAVNGNPYDHGTLFNSVGHGDFLPGNNFAHATVRISNDAIVYYINGLKGIEYARDKQLGAASAYTVGMLIDYIVAQAKENGLRIFAGDFPALDDIYVMEALTDAEVAEHYADVAFGLSGIYKQAVGDESPVLYKSFSYANVVAGIASAHADYNVSYLVDPADDHTSAEGDDVENDVNKPSITFGAKHIAAGLTRAFGADAVVNTEVERSTPVTSDDGSTTTYNETWTISAGAWKKVIVIGFTKNDPLAARKKLTNISYANKELGVVTLDGFAPETLAYTVALTPDYAAVPEVTYTALMPDEVTITTNKDETFNGIQFVYTISIFDKAELVSNPTASAIGEYTITFNRAIARTIESVTVNNQFFGTFNKTKYSESDGSTNQQNIYLKTIATQASQVTVTRTYTNNAVSTATVSMLADNVILITLKDVPSNTDCYYAIKQIVTDANTAPAFSFAFNNKTLVQGTGSGGGGTSSWVDTTSSSRKVVVSNRTGTTLTDSYMTLSSTTKATISNSSGISSETLNADGFTVTTWMRMKGAAAAEWAGLITVTGSAGHVIANVGGFINYTGTSDWTNTGSSTTPVSGVITDGWAHVALVVGANGYAAYYVNGAMVRSVNDIALNPANLTYENITIVLGASPFNNEYIGNGDIKDVKIYNAPLLSATLFDLYSASEAGKLSSLKMDGQQNNIDGFTPGNYSYNISLSYDHNDGISAASFPTFIATNSRGDGVTNITVKYLDGDGGFTSDEYATGARARYTIVSDVDGFSFTYTVTVTLADINSTISKVTISYAGAYHNINSEILVGEFAQVDDTNVYTAEYKVWTDCVLTDLVVDAVKGVPSQTIASSWNSTVLTFTVYAEDNSSTIYRITFVEDANVLDPDKVQGFVLISDQTATITTDQTYDLVVDYPVGFNFSVTVSDTDIASLSILGGNPKTRRLTPKKAGVVELALKEDGETIKTVTITIELAGLIVLSQKNPTISLIETYELEVDYPVGFVFTAVPTDETKDLAEIEPIGVDNKKFEILPNLEGVFVIELKNNGQTVDTVSVTIVEEHEVDFFSLTSAATATITTAQTHTISVDFSSHHTNVSAVITSGNSLATVTAVAGSNNKQFRVNPSAAGTVTVEIRSGITAKATVTITIVDATQSEFTLVSNLVASINVGAVHTIVLNYTPDHTNVTVAATAATALVASIEQDATNPMQYKVTGLAQGTAIIEIKSNGVLMYTVTINVGTGTGGVNPAGLCGSVDTSSTSGLGFMSVLIAFAFLAVALVKKQKAFSLK